MIFQQCVGVKYFYHHKRLGGDKLWGRNQVMDLNNGIICAGGWWLMTNNMLGILAPLLDYLTWKLNYSWSHQARGSHSGAFYVLCHYFPDSKFVSARHHKLFSGQKLKNLMFNTCRKNKGILNIHMFYVLWTLKNLYKCVSWIPRNKGEWIIFIGSVSVQFQY